MRNDVRLRVTDDPRRWARALHASGQSATAFHSYQWLTVAAGMTDHAFVPLVVEVNGVDVGVAPWLARRRGGLVTVNRVPFSYTGPLVPDEHLDATVGALGRRGLRHLAVVQQHQLPPGVPSRVRAHTRRGQTYLLDTSQGEVALWSGLSSTYRKRIRQNERNGIMVSESAAAPDTLTQVTKAVFGRRGLQCGYNERYPPHRSELERHGLEVHWTVVQRDDVQLGSLLTLRYGDTALLWMGGVIPEHQGSNANVSLYWEAICWAANAGVKTLDLVGVPDAGIGLFKSRFGATLCDHAVIVIGMPGVMKLRKVVRNRLDRKHLSSRTTGTNPKEVL